MPLRLSQPSSVYVDFQFSEINLKLSPGDLNGVVWKVAADYSGVFKGYNCKQFRAHSSGFTVPQKTPSVNTAAA